MAFIYRQKDQRRKDGTVIVRKKFMMGLSVNGKTKYESTGTTSAMKAQRIANARETDLDRGAPLNIGRVKFDDAVTLIENDYLNKGRRSLGDLRRRIKLHLRPAFGGMKMADVTTGRITDYTTARRAHRCSECRWSASSADDAVLTMCPDCRKPIDDGASKATVDNELAALKRMFKLCVKAGRLGSVPQIDMLHSGDTNARTGFFERDQLDAVLQHLAEPLREVVLFAYITGWRTDSEILPLQWRQVDDDGGVVRLDPTPDQPVKNNTGRTFPFDAMPELLAVIRQQRKRRVGLCPFVFHRDGQQIKAFRTEWMKATKAAGWPDKLVHDFRRTATRNLVRAGVPEKTAMLLTGHKSRRIFDRYNIVNEDDLRAAVGKLATAAAAGPASKGRVFQMKRKGGRR